MTIISKSIIINAPVSKVQAFLDNASQTPEWYEGMEGINPEPGYPTEVGSKATIDIKSGGMTLNSTLQITKNEPEKLRQFSMAGMVSGTNTWQLKPDGNKTHVDLTIDYQMSGGGFGKMMDKLFVERINDKNAGQSLKNLKAKIEA